MGHWGRGYSVDTKFNFVLIICGILYFFEFQVILNMIVLFLELI